MKLGDRGESVSLHQRHLNDRLRAHGDPPIRANGTCGKATIEGTARAAWFLGALNDTVTAMGHGAIPVGVQRMIAKPDAREATQRRRARERRGKQFPGDAPRKFRVVPCKEWGAVAATRRVTRVGKPTKIIFHHTDGHTAGKTLDQAKAYARSIQHDHMHRNPAFIDSGHNFLVTRAGHILEGRHGSLAAIKAGVMVQSAHCIGENVNPGIEHEHKGGEHMTSEQREASLFLHELICRATGIKPKAILPHGQFDQTECPGALKPDLTQFRKDLARRLAQ
jgi:hypothetical protein